MEAFAAHENGMQGFIEKAVVDMAEQAVGLVRDVLRLDDAVGNLFRQRQGLGCNC